MIAYKLFFRRIRRRRLSARTERGSTFLIVLAILSVMALTAATFTYTSGLEVRASANFARAVQARMAAMTGLPAASSVISSREGLAVAYSQRWAKAAEAASRQSAQSSAASRSGNASNGAPASARLAWARASQSVPRIEDASARLAIDCLVSDAESERIRGGVTVGQLRDAIARTVESRGLEGLDASALANSIAAKVLGPNGERDWPEMSNAALTAGLLLPADPRLPSPGDDEPLICLEQLCGMIGMPADPGLAAEALEALSGVLTVYSQSRLAYESGGALYDSLDPNTATIEEIFEGLSRVFGDVPPGRLQQFAANIVDWRDADSIPTVYPGSSESAPILGVENTPFISEVWPDSLTTEADGDDGQYFEIANPYSFDVDLTGWTVGIGLSGRRISLSGALPAQGCLVVTDDKNDLRDASPEEPQNEYGSFFKIFSMLGDGYSRQLREEPLLNLPDDSGTLYLYDNAGNLIDYFQYQNMRLGGVRTSAQRDDPRARDYAKNRCSPMSLELSAAAKAALRSAANRDRAFASAAEVFDVCAAWTERASARSLDSASTSPWTRLKSAEGELDARLADLFAVGEDSGLPGNLAPMESYAARPAQNAAAGKPEAAGAENGLARMEREAVRQDTAIRRASGRINLNTASRAALLALPGMTADMANRILDRRAAGNGASGPSEGYMEGIGARPPFESIAGFLGDETIWSGKSREEKLALFGEWANRITINSQTFFVVAENQPEPQVGRTRPSVARIRSLMLVGANGRPEALNWRFEQ